MSGYGARFARVAGEFGRRVDAVPASAWESLAPCEGWVARDVVGHLVEWVPAFLRTYAGIDVPGGPAVADDPAGAWGALRSGLQAVLDDASTASSALDLHGARYVVEQAVDMFVTSDVFLHTWDLARAAGLDERLDPDEVHRMLAGIEPMDDALRQSGHYGPKVAVPADADEQTRLLAFIGRRP